MSRKHYEDRATLRDGEGATKAPEGEFTSRRAQGRNTTWRTLAVAEQADAVDYLARCRDGEHGEYGAWLVGEFMPKGVAAYPPGDQVSCAGRIKAKITAYELTGSGLGPFARVRTPDEAARDMRDIFGEG